MPVKKIIEKNFALFSVVLNANRIRALSFSVFILLTVFGSGASGLFAQSIATETVYKLRNQCSGKIMTVSGSGLENGSAVQQWTDNLSTLNQAWMTEATDSGYFRLIARHSGKVLSGASDASYAVNQWASGASPNQQWKFIDGGNGYYKLEPHQTPGKLLSLSRMTKSNGASVKIYPANGTCAQNWKIEPVKSSGEEFAGPFQSWVNVKTDFGARGDGIADDTVAFQNALNALGQTGNKPVLYIPAGAYRLTGTITLTRRIGVVIVGEDPNTTRLVWDGPYNSSTDTRLNTGVMFLGQGSTGVRIGRLTLDGRNRLNFGIRWRWGGYSTADYFPTGNH